MTMITCANTQNRFNTSAMDKKTALEWSLGRKLIAAFKGLPEAPAQVSGVVVSNEILPWKSARIWHGTYGACQVDREHWNSKMSKTRVHPYLYSLPIQRPKT